jgi:hypothetical protein
VVPHAFTRLPEFDHDDVKLEQLHCIHCDTILTCKQDIRYLRLQDLRLLGAPLKPHRPLSFERKTRPTDGTHDDAVAHGEVGENEEELVVPPGPEGEQKPAAEDARCA